MVPLYAINSDITRLPYDINFFGVIPQPLQKIQASLVAQCTQCFGSLMSAHGVFFFVLQYAPQRRNSGIVTGLAQAVGEFVFEEGRWRGKRGANGFDGGDCLLRRRMQACEVLQREESAESASERLRFGCEDLAQGENLGILLCDCHIGDL